MFMTNKLHFLKLWWTQQLETKLKNTICQIIIKWLFLTILVVFYFMGCNQGGERTLPLLIQFGGVHPPPPQCRMLSARYLVWKCPRWVSRARSACLVKTTAEYFDQYLGSPKKFTKNILFLFSADNWPLFLPLTNKIKYSCRGT